MLKMSQLSQSEANIRVKNIPTQNKTLIKKSIQKTNTHHPLIFLLLDLNKDVEE